MKKLRLGLVGYFGFGNYGDELFRRVFEELLPECELEVVHESLDPPYHPDARRLEKRVDGFDALLVGGGDLVIPYAMSSLYWRREFLRRPVYITGVGVPRWGGGRNEVILELRSFFQHENVRFVEARDVESRDWIAKYLMPRVPARWSPDLVCALDFPFQAEPSGSERIFGIVTRAHTDLEHAPLEALARRALGMGYRLRQIVLGTDRVARDDLGAAEEFVARFPAPLELVRRESIDELTESLGECDALASMKFHGCVAAYLSGVPVISMSGSDKFVSFFRQIEKEPFVSTWKDPLLERRLIDPMYRIERDQVESLRARTRSSLLELRDRLASDF